MDIKYFNAQLPLKGLIYTQVLVILQQEQAQKSEEFHYINFKYKFEHGTYIYRGKRHTRII